MTTQFQKIDFDNWNRSKLFKFYIEKMRIVMSLTVDVDVAPILRFTKENGMKFYPAMIWVVSKVINAHEEFRFGWNGDDLILWDSISPSYTVAVGDENFAKFVTEYNESLQVFYETVMADRGKYKDAEGVIDNQALNFFDVSCLPWIKYNHFDVHVFDDGKFLAPVVTWGRFVLDGEKAMMPLTMNINHAVADGFHVSRFFNEVQEQIYSFENTKQ